MGHGVISTNTTVLRQLTRSLHAVFREQLESPHKGFEQAIKFFMEVNSTGDQEDYNWLGSIPGMEEWIDARPHAALRQFGQTIKNKDYANGIKMPLNWIDDDKLGQVMPRVRGLADGYKTHVYDQFISLIETGAATACYDGLNFFSATHAEGDSGAQSNYNVGGSALGAANLEAAVAVMQEYVDDRGKLMHITPTHLWTSPAQRTTAYELVHAERDAAGATNMNKGLLDVIIVPGLTNTLNWGLVDLSKSLKPLIKQNRRPVSFTAMDKIDDEFVYNQREVRYGADYRGGFGYGFWQLMYLDNGA